MVKPGDSIPSVELEEGAPGNKVNLATEFADSNGLIIGVPAAFSTFSIALFHATDRSLRSSTGLPIASQCA
jgi:hypothetical protein